MAMRLKHHFSFQSKRSSYEEFPDATVGKPRRGFGRYLTFGLIIGLFLTLLLFLLKEKLFMGYPSAVVQQVQHTHKETIPTLLQLVDPETGNFLYALDNPVYDLLAKATLHSSHLTLSSNHQKLIRKIRQYPTISLLLRDDNSHIVGTSKEDPSPLIGHSITLSWTLGLDRDGQAVVTDDDTLILLLCDNNSIVEAATLSQVRATQSHFCHDCVNSHQKQNEWHIPSLPKALPYNECHFRLYHRLPDSRNHNYYLLAETKMLHMTIPSQPTGIHLALTNQVDTVLVQFATTSSGTPVVQLQDRTIAGNSDTYTSSDMCQAPANTTAPGQFMSPGYLHTVSMSNLQPNTEYKYRVGLAAGQGVTWSPMSYTFTTALSAGDVTEHSFLVYGDQGCPSAGWELGSAWVETMLNDPANFRTVHHVGDLSYASGAAHQWDMWLDMVEPLAARVPLMIAVGNHEYDHKSGGASKDPSGVPTDSGFMPIWGNFADDSGGECGVPTAKRFTMPRSVNSNGVFWYSYDFGLVHTIVISSEHDLSEGSRQYMWLQKELHTIDRTLTPWVVLESHRPLYEGEVNWAQNSVGVGMRNEIEDLLYDYKVDVVFSGHYHAFHRTCDGLYRSTCHSGGPIHVTIGTAGAHLDAADTPIFSNSWTANVILQQYGYGRVTVKNATSMHFEFVRAGNDTDVLDEFWIIRKR